MNRRMDPSRRSILAGIALTLPGLRAMQEPPVHGISALLEGTGMVRIPAGEFLMGSEDGGADEAPVHRVRISRDFEMSKVEVTQAQWESVISDAHSKPGTVRVSPQGAPVSGSPSHFKGPALPVESVSWDDIQVFLTRLNARAGGYIYRLPTEAEWEYACRADTHSGPPEDLGSAAWYAGNSDKRTQPVGQKAPNAWGLHDMYGNVSEWVRDWYGHDYYVESAAADPSGPDSGSYRVFRGGCWFDEPQYCRPAARKFDFPGSRMHNVGFRVVRTAKVA